MRFIPFFPSHDSRELLEAEYEGEAAAAELEAELGSGYFSGGASSWDASTMARQDRMQRQQDFEATPEGALHMAQVEAAKFMQSARRDLDLVDYNDMMNPFVFTPVGGTTVPEWFPGENRIVGGVSNYKPSDDDLPF